MTMGLFSNACGTDPAGPGAAARPFSVAAGQMRTPPAPSASQGLAMCPCHTHWEVCAALAVQGTHEGKLLRRLGMPSEES